MINNMDQVTGVINALACQFGMSDTIDKVGLNNYMAELSNKIIAYELASCKLWVTIATIAIAVAAVLAILSFLSIQVFGYDAWIPFWIFVIIGCVAVIILIYNLHRITVCQTFPDKIVLEYMRDTLKQMLNAAN